MSSNKPDFHLFEVLDAASVLITLEREFNVSKGILNTCRLWLAKCHIRSLLEQCVGDFSPVTEGRRFRYYRRTNSVVTLVGDIEHQREVYIELFTQSNQRLEIASLPYGTPGREVLVSIKG